MNIVICKNPKNYNLTLDKEYEIIGEDDNRFIVLNDKNKEIAYSKNLFTEKEDIPPLTLDEVLKNIKIENKNFVISLPKYKLKFEEALNSYFYTTTASSSGISCGVYSRNSINSNYSHFKSNITKKDTFSKFLENINKVSEDDISENLLIDELFLFILNDSFKKTCNFENNKDSLKKGVHLLISLKEKDFTEYFLKRLKSQHTIHHTIVNRNSNNTITTFVIGSYFCEN